MNLQDILTEDVIRLDLAADTKSAVLEELVDILADAGKLTDRDAVLKAVLEREAKMSTGMQNGIAIPHGKCDSVEGLVAAIAIKKGGIDFDALDGEPSQLFIVTLSPVDRTGPHIQFLSEVSQLLNKASCRERLLNATSVQEVRDIVCSACDPA